MTQKKTDSFQQIGIVVLDRVRKQFPDLLRLVQLDPVRVIDSYAYELSGGMRQRSILAISLLLDSQILNLDEPTVALDILTQRTIINLLRGLKEDLQFTMLFISHDLAIAMVMAAEEAGELKCRRGLSNC